MDKDWTEEIHDAVYLGDDYPIPDDGVVETEEYDEPYGMIDCG